MTRMIFSWSTRCQCKWVGSSYRPPNLAIIWSKRIYQWIIQIEQCLRLLRLAGLYYDVNTFNIIFGNTFNMFKAIQFIINYCSHKYSAINLHEIGCTNMDTRTNPIFPLGLNMTQHVLLMFRDNLLTFNHCLMLPNSVFTKLQHFVVSSANGIE